jgi:hypothetical protein
MEGPCCIEQLFWDAFCGVRSRCRCVLVGQGYMAYAQGSYLPTKSAMTRMSSPTSNGFAR